MLRVLFPRLNLNYTLNFSTLILKIRGFVGVVFMPCAELFSEQDAECCEAVLIANIRARVAVEATHVDY